MVITTVGMFVSCKDYDDDITDLRNQITSNATDLQSLVDEKINNVTSEISSLQTQSSSLQSAYQAADAALQATLESAISSATTTANAYADVQAAQAQTASIAAAQELVDNAIASLQASLDAANATIESQGSTIASLLTADATLTQGMQTAQARADEAYTLAQNAYDLAQSAQTAADNAASVAAGKADASVVEALNTTVETLNTTVDALSTTVDGLSTTVDGLNGSITSLGTTANDAYTQAVANLASIEAIQGQLSDLSASDSTILASIDALKTTVAANNDELTQRCADIETSVTANSASIAEQETAITSLKSEVTANAIAAQAYADAVAQAAADNLQKAVDGINSDLDDVKGDIDGINTSIAALEAAYVLADETLEKEIGDLKTEIASVQTTLESSIATLESSINGQITDINTQIANILVVIGEVPEGYKSIQEEINAINTALDNLTDINDFSQLSKKVSDNADSIAVIQADLQTINSNLAFESKRLKSLVFAPTTYVDGIEAIMFATLEYEAWDESKLEADAPTTGKTYIIDDANHIEEYLVNPKNIDLNDITDLSFISNTATNTFTRGVSQSAPIDVADKSLSNGVLSLKLTKNVTTSFGTDDEKFTIVALKATLSDKLLTDEEIAAGEKVAIYSDWARLYETSVTPYIHNAIVGQGVDTSNKLVETNDASHFYTYSTLYDGKTSKDVLDSSNDGAYIVKKVVYTDSLDLSTLVMVCDENKTSYDAASYGLTFEFKIMPYQIDNDNNDATDQANFAKLASDGKTIYSTAEDNETTGSRVAIGRQPAIQVVLRDTKNNKVVDVKYFKIQWVSNAVNPDEPVVKTADETAEFSGTYECGGSYSGTLGEAFLNELYKENDMTKAEFHDTYTLNTTLFATEEAASTTEGKADSALGTITDVTDGSGDAQTHNIAWDIDYAEVTQAEYNAGKKTIDAWAYFEDKYGDRVVFKLTLTLTVKQLSIISTNAPYWDDTHAQNLNPTLYDTGTYSHAEGYGSSMILSNLLYSYMNNLVSPTTIDGMIVSNDNYTAGTANFIFDSDQLSSLPKAKSTDKWTLSNDGLTLYYNGEVAATINGNGCTTGDEGIIQLAETPSYGAEGSVPTAGAKLLVGNSVKIKLVAQYCSMSAMQVLDEFNINFLEPLTFTTSSQAVTVNDLTNGGSSSTEITNTIRVTEELTSNPYIVYSNYASDNGKVTAGLDTWYGLTVTFDSDNAKCNIIDGGLSTECNTLLSSIKTASGDKTYDITIDPDTQTLTYVNNGTAISQSFNIEIPITISSKWQADYNAVLKVTVLPSSTVSGN